MKALKLRRVVEVYQWQEDSRTKKRTNVGGSETMETIYEYRKVWSEDLIDSSAFYKSSEHVNPTSKPIESQEFVADTIQLGSYRLSRAFIDKLKFYEDYNLTRDHFGQLDPRLQSRFQLSGNAFFAGDPAEPRIGDIKVRFQIIEPQRLSAVGVLENGYLDAFMTDRGEISLLEQGQASAEMMFKNAERHNALMTWLLRLVGFLVMWIGLLLVTAPLKVFADFIPFMGALVGGGLAAIAALIAFTLSFVTMALAWIFFRPLIGGALLIVALGSAAAVAKAAKRKATTAKAEMNEKPV